MKRRIWIPVFLLAVLLLAGGLYLSLRGGEDEEQPGEGYPTLTIKQQDYTVTREFTARIATVNPAAVRPQVSGRITKICVREGAHVKQGQPLVVIDQVPFQAAVRNAEARVASAKAQLATARLNLEGREELHRQHVVGDFDLSKARNAMAEAEGALAEAQADLASARNELSYSVVTSPTDGVISMLNYRVGENVSPSMDLELTTVSDPRHLYAYVAVSEKTLNDLLEFYHCQLDDIPSKLPDLTLVSYWGKELRQKGRFDAVSGNVEASTGSVILRASFENSEGLFRNGSNATIVMPYELKNAIVIPQEATYDILNKRFVYKVTDGTAKACEIKVFPYDNGQDYVVTDGLEPGDVIIAEGAGLISD